MNHDLSRDHRSIVFGLMVGMPLLMGAPLHAEPGATPQDKKVDIDARYVKDNIKTFLEPTTATFKPDGSVELFFDFRKKNEGHSEIFLPKVQRDTRQKWRWTVTGEEDWTYKGKSTTKTWLVRGIKMGDNGMALLDCYFTDDVEVEIEMTPFTNYSKGQRTAIVYYTDKHNAIGSNFGEQCAVFKKQKVRRMVGKVDPVPMESRIKTGLRVRGGKFEALRQGRTSGSMPYKEKDYKSGRVGFIWGGNANAVINYMKVTGKIDTEKMAKKIRKGRRKRR